MQGDFGTSLLLEHPRSPGCVHRARELAEAALVAFVIVVPLSILGGVIAALSYDKPTDRIISIVGLSLSAVPEFVSGIVLVLIFCIWLGWLPLASTVPPGSSQLAVWGHLFLPALPLVFVLFGYITRIARAGTIEALDADYTRTAYLKGLTRGRAPPTRPPELAAADDHRRCDTGRVPDRRTRRRRDRCSTTQGSGT